MSDIRRFLNSEMRRKLRHAKTAAKCLRKLKNNPGATYQQKQSWKYHIALAYRENPTPAEEKLKIGLLAVKDQYRWNLSFQKQIGPYIADCVIGNHWLVIEVDGSIHETTKEYDKAREQRIHQAGYRVIRYANEKVINHWPEVLGDIVKQCSADST